MDFKQWLVEVGEYSSQGRLVSPAEFERAKQSGLALVGVMRQNKPLPLQHLEENFNAVVKMLYQKTVLTEWGGVTYDPRTGDIINRGFASALGINNIQLPISEAMDFDTFVRTFKAFVRRNKESLMLQGHYIGLFRDEKTETVDFDVSILVHNKDDAENVQLALGLKGGAYDFATGNGIFAPRLGV